MKETRGLEVDAESLVSLAVQVETAIKEGSELEACLKLEQVSKLVYLMGVRCGVRMAKKKVVKESIE